MTFESQNNSKVRAHTNIALVKYWGKENEALKIPTTSSLSLTLDKFYTDTEVTFKNELAADQIIFNGEAVKGNKAKRITNFLNIVREMAGKNIFAEVKTSNNVPTAAGLASSASGFAALAGAASKAIGLKLNKKELSRLARRGSGSATRSIYGGFVEWQKGFGDQTSIGVPFIEKVDWNIHIVAILVNKSEKEMTSTQGMKISKDTSPYYVEWKKLCKRDLKNIKIAIKAHDFSRMGKIAEENAMRMHALTLSADPDFTYFDADSLKVMKLVHNLRQRGIECYFTMDAGPNVKILVEDHNLVSLKQELKKDFDEDKIIVASPGPGIKYLK
ncbi:diphosphomevalonate decarboxylase [Fructilactobacillus lindneri]|uniref:diphosphomevalonate decarboxylase n=2 Tax=Fructilactobacillus lindneri TaxID=53444 RepID=A0A0R2JVG6_9LACO|nr:diphosphomevalonate decarboxylase [Fructilactobacillus lindneri]ANZ58196.1 diphosphomevalonate decarboxylase [Fructilactobacillus lindneri]ANZ59517.1 diphosphomevalonate decarboxylase [Fructilactobacillus lindneri]KRN79020.1 hypothetical protein IV52_GL000425 [Fructilactobacillus lindneri DSM 20690 = JCM 11027]POH04087.1 diphosphomevalonate decarboxylase [Fructilactobacillus lindneri]POH04671.1 diphosphomevalonate decarboxylase [Fructilactobacillus lindneri]